jgi:hypothetical protein
LETRLVRLRLAVAVIIGLVLVAVAGRYAYGALVVIPGLESDDPLTFMTARLDAQRWGFPVDGDGSGEALFASHIKISGPAAVSGNGGFDEELRFVVSYNSVWKSATGAPPGHRQYFVYVGRDKGDRWRVLGGGTGP